MTTASFISLISALLCTLQFLHPISLTSAFTLPIVSSRSKAFTSSNPFVLENRGLPPSKSSAQLFASDDDGSSLTVAESDQVVIGLAGTIMALITFYSEYTLKTTGCGLPAGPFGLLGFAEGISYLGVAGIVAFSLYTKLKTGSGLPSGPGGLLGAAEGLSYLAIVAGVVVFGFQIVDYGYIPNAVPIEGGMCS